MAHCALDGFTHGATERDTVGQLLSDGLRDQLCGGVHILDFKNVQLNLLAGELFQLSADAVRFGSTAADHDAGARGVDVYTDAVTGALDDNIGDAGALEPLGQEVADLDVFSEVIGVRLVGVPA